MRLLYIHWAVLIVAALNSCSSTKLESRVLESWQTNNGRLTIRITSYSDPPTAIEPGASYVFESSTGDTGWNKIATVHKDISEPINKEAIRFVNDEIAYVSEHWMFASTTNGGREWVVWDSRDFNYSDTEIRWGIIRSVAIDADGNGEMTLRVFPSSNACQKLSSQDFGRTWVEGGPLGKCLD